MKVQYHVVASGFFAGVLYATTRSWIPAVICFVAGVGMDMDHLLDYILEHYKSFSIRHFFSTWESGNLRRAYLIFHSWELVGLLILTTLLLHGDHLALGLAVGIGHHLVLDQIAYRPHPLAYSVTWRWHNNFGLHESFRNAAKENENNV